MILKAIHQLKLVNNHLQMLLCRPQWLPPSVLPFIVIFRPIFLVIFFSKSSRFLYYITMPSQIILVPGLQRKLSNISINVIEYDKVMFIEVKKAWRSWVMPTIQCVMSPRRLFSSSRVFQLILWTHSQPTYIKIVFFLRNGKQICRSCKIPIKNYRN